jgi:diguanylate cyclase (GGDEF)-like protein/PAS domain S-box-containing protein
VNQEIVSIVNLLGLGRAKVAMMNNADFAEVDHSRLESTKWSRIRELLDPRFIQREQVQSVAANNTKTVLSSSVVVALVMNAFMGTANISFVIVWSMIGFVIAIASILHARVNDSWKSAELSFPKASIQISSATLARGIHWAFGIAYLLPISSPEQKFLLGWVTVGMAAGGAFAYWRLPLAAVTYVTAILAGGIVGLLRTGSGLEIGLAVGVFVYCIYILRNTLENAALLRNHIATSKNLAESREDMAQLLKNFEEDSSDWLWEASIDLSHRRNMDRFARALGCERNLLDNASWYSLLEPHLATEEQSLAFARFTGQLSRGDTIRGEELEFGKFGEERCWKISAHPVRGSNGAVQGWHGIVSDISEHKMTERKIVHLAHHDALTGLPNRAKFSMSFDEQMQAGRHRGLQSYLLYLDLDGFKVINDTLGHVFGDKLLRQVCDRLRGLLGAKTLTCRYGGDEFLVLLENLESREIAEQQAKLICESLAKPFDIAEQHILIGVSIGAANIGSDGATLSELLRHADLALYRAKDSGRGQVAFYDQTMNKAERDKLQLKLDMRKALSNNQFSLHYQPIVEVCSSKVVGYEALLRWKHPTRGNVPPLDFIPVAEENGFIVEIGEWVLREACQQAATWSSELRVAVNLSTVQMRSNKILTTVTSALADARLPAHRLELEVTETALIETRGEAVAVLNALRALGVHIALDDFGTGYSSLAYLHEFAFDKIKIDRSFVQSCQSRKQSEAVVNAVLKLANDLGISTVAEGVETNEQLDMLIQKGCHEAQGWLLGRPKPADEIFGAKPIKLPSVA